MINQILNIISDITMLLKECGWDEKAKWFSDLQFELSENDVDSIEFQESLDELENSIGGIGSFSDLPLKTKTGSRSQQELRDMQWDLAEKLGEAVEELINRRGLKK